MLASNLYVLFAKHPFCYIKPWGFQQNWFPEKKQGSCIDCLTGTSGSIESLLRNRNNASLYTGWVSKTKQRRQKDKDRQTIYLRGSSPLKIMALFHLEETLAREVE